MPEKNTPTPEEIGLCVHGQLPEICSVCTKTELGAQTQKEIREEAKSVGSEIAQNLWEKLETEGKVKPEEMIYDMVMVLGAGYRDRKVDANRPIEQRKANFLLNEEFRMRLNAAAQLYLEGRTRMICTTGGKGITPPWDQYPSLGELGKRYLIEKFNIPEQNIIFEDQSDATHGNLAHGLCLMYRDNLPIGNFGIVSTNYHLNRAREMAKKKWNKISLPACRKSVTQEKSSLCTIRFRMA